MEAQQPKSNSTSVVVILMVVLVAGGLVYAMMNRNSSTPTTTTEVTTPSTAAEETAQPTEAMEGAESMSDIKEFTVVGTPFAYSPKEIKVKKGDKVRVIFDNKQGTHDFVIDELNVRTKVLNAGGKETVEFVAEKVGTFEYYCSVGNHRQMGMVGNLIVE